jgi:hypothetical protein
VRSDAGLVEQLWCKSARECFDLACELAFFCRQLQDASGDRAQREHAAAELRIASTTGSCRREAAQQSSTGERPQLATQRVRGGDQQVSQLAEAGTIGGDRALACGHQCLQRLAFTACPRCRGLLAGDHTAGGADRVERVGLAARAALPPQPTHHEHPLTKHHQEARQTGTERSGAFDSERPPAGCLLADKLQSLRVAHAARDDRRLEDDRAADDVHDRERVRVAVRVDSDDLVQLIRKHPKTDHQPKRWGTHPVSVWAGKPRAAEL